MNQGGVYRNRLKLEKVKQHEIITILGDRVRAGKVLMLVIDVAQSVFSLGLLRVVCKQGEMTLEDVEGCNDN